MILHHIASFVWYHKVLNLVFPSIVFSRGWITSQSSTEKVISNFKFSLSEQLVLSSSSSLDVSLSLKIEIFISEILQNKVIVNLPNLN